MKQGYESDTENSDILGDDPLDILLDDELCVQESQSDRSMIEENPVLSPMTVASSSRNSLSDDDSCPLLSQTQSEDEMVDSLTPALTEEDYLKIDSIVADITDTPEKKPNVVWNGFRLLGDNFDKRVKPRHQTMEQKNKEYHAFAYAGVKDRINLSAFLDSHEPPVLSKEHIMTAIPDSQDCQKVEENFCILVSRVLSKHMPEFEEFASLIPSHIPHKYSSEMSQKSEIVSAYNCYCLCMWSIWVLRV